MSYGVFQRPIIEANITVLSGFFDEQHLFRIKVTTGREIEGISLEHKAWPTLCSQEEYKLA